jgi:hypothetical protein
MFLHELLSVLYPDFPGDELRKKGVADTTNGF